MSDVDDDGWYLHVGAGMLSDPVMRKMMSPERWEAEQAALERERLQLEEEAEARRTELSEQAWLAMRRGEQRHTVAEKLAAVAAAADRADRREARKAHPVDCGCSTCGERISGAGAVDRLPRRLPSIVDRELAAKEAEFMAQPADIGLVSHMVAALEAKADRKIKHALGRLGRR